MIGQNAQPTVSIRKGENPMSPYTVEHIALDMEFYHAHSTSLRPDESIIETFEHDKEHAEIFLQKDTQTAFSQVEILNWFLLQTQTSIEDHLPKDAPPPKQGASMMVTFPIRFAKNTFSMQTEDGEQDLSHLKLMCKVTNS